MQSPLIVEDSLARDAASEVRPGVRLDPATRTAQDSFLYHREVWPAGTVFPVRFELVVRDALGAPAPADDPASDPKHADKLLRGLVTALGGLDDGSIRLGRADLARTRRGRGGPI